MKPVFVGEIDLEPARLPRARLIANPRGRLKIWKHPVPERRYCGAGDLGEGLGKDFSECIIETAELKGEVVAYWYSNTTSVIETALCMYALGCYYNWALMGIEKNSIGMTAVTTFIEGHPEYPQMYEYPRIYKHKALDKATGEYVDRLGFRTDAASKENAVNLLRETIMKEWIKVYDERIIKQLLGFGIDPSKRGAGRWTQKTMDPSTKMYHDDAAMTMIICEKMRREAITEDTGPSTAANW